MPSGVTLISESHIDLKSFNLTIQKGTGVDSICYKINDSNTYSATISSSITLKVISGSKYYYYGTPKNGYKMSSCTRIVLALVQWEIAKPLKHYQLLLYIPLR